MKLENSNSSNSEFRRHALSLAHRLSNSTQDLAVRFHNITAHSKIITEAYLTYATNPFLRPSIYYLAIQTAVLFFATRAMKEKDANDQRLNIVICNAIASIGYYANFIGGNTKSLGPCGFTFCTTVANSYVFGNTPDNKTNVKVVIGIAVAGAAAFIGTLYATGQDVLTWENGLAGGAFGAANWCTLLESGANRRRLSAVSSTLNCGVALTENALGVALGSILVLNTNYHTIRSEDVSDKGWFGWLLGWKDVLTETTKIVSDLKENTGSVRPSPFDPKFSRHMAP